MLGNGNGPFVVGNGPHMLGIMLHSGLYGIWDYDAFGIMSFGIMSHLGLFRILIMGFKITLFWLLSFGLKLFSCDVVQHNVGV